MIKFLIDENLPACLKRQGCEDIHAGDFSGRMTDTELWNHAKNNGYVIVTKDADFYERIQLSGSPPKIVWVRIGNIKRRELVLFLAGKWVEIIPLLETFEMIEVYPDRMEGVRL